MQLSFFGAAKEVGRSAILLETKKSSALLDYGLKLSSENSEEPQYPIAPQKFVDALILSHAHLDHCGAIPNLFKASEPRVFTNGASVPIMQLLLEDSAHINRMKGFDTYNKTQIKRTLRNTEACQYKEPHHATPEISFKFFDAGHILGASTTLLEAEKKKLIYSGDFKDTDTHLHKGAEHPGKCDALIVESTYGDREHPDRETTEKYFIEEIKSVIESGGSVLLPAFAVGRSQELVSMLYAHKVNCPVYLDGMCRAVAEIYLDFPELLRDYDEFFQSMRWVNWIKDRHERKEVFNEPSVIVSSAGMLSGGPSVSYIREIKYVKKSAVFLSGFQVPGTPGHKLIEEGKFEYEDEITDFSGTKIRYFDFSAHADKHGIHEFVKKADPSVVFVNHGEAWQCDALKDWIENERGCYVFAPGFGEKHKVGDYL